MNYSRQRELIEQAIFQSPVHPTAENVYAAVKCQLPHISLGTVYRNLNQLAEMGAIQKISIPGSPDHFDKRLDPHYHLHCKRCGRLLDLPQLSSMDAVMSTLNHFRQISVMDVQLYISGICPECNMKTKERRNFHEEPEGIQNGGQPRRRIRRRIPGPQQIYLLRFQGEKRGV